MNNILYDAYGNAVHVGSMWGIYRRVPKPFSIAHSANPNSYHVCLAYDVLQLARAAANNINVSCWVEYIVDDFGTLQIKGE